MAILYCQSSISMFIRCKSHFKIPTNIYQKRQMSEKSSIQVLHTIPSYRIWREGNRRLGRSVGFVPTMGALHPGHLSLVEKSLRENDCTVVSIFVNPAQFAPHEDLESYPRTLESDLGKLSTLSLSPDIVVQSTSNAKGVDVVFAPSVTEMYPNGIHQNVDQQKGTFIEVKGYSHQMEGGSRPHFFRGVATVVTKLFNVIEPDHAYLGQKDIQQALLLRRMCKDLLMARPSAEHLHIVPTSRANSGLALSSRNNYLTPEELSFASTLYEALVKGGEAFVTGGREEAVMRAMDHVRVKQAGASAAGVELKLDYVEFNDAETFEVVNEMSKDGTPVIFSGAMWVGRTRLIDNILLGDYSKILY